MKTSKIEKQDIEVIDSEDEHRPTKRNKRTSASSRVNFSKLTPHEKDIRQANLARLVKKLRRSN